MIDSKNNLISGSIKSKQISVIHWRLHLLIVCSGGLIISLMGYSSYLGTHMVEKYAPLIDATMEIKLEATTSHLWFEEILSGDRYEDMDEIHKRLALAKWYAMAMLKGGQNPEGIFLPLKKQVLRDEVKIIAKKIDTFHEITNSRFESFQEKKRTDSQINQKYDAIFRDFIGQADRVESKLQAENAKELQLLKITQIILLSISLISLAVIIYQFQRFEIRRNSDLQRMNKTNQRLQCALNEIKTLRGTIPICSICKQIRDEKGSWNQLEAYIHNNSDAEFSHGLCPECFKKEMEVLERDN